MKSTCLLVALGVAAGLAASASAQSRDAAPRNDLPQPYRTTRDWGQLPPGTAKWAAVTAVEVARDGSIYVIHRHRNGRNNRVVKLDRTGKYLKEWGMKGSGPGQISEPHTIAMDSRGRLFVGDRENNRIQIFDQDGTLLDIWHQFGRPSGIFITKDDTIYVTDSESGPDSDARE